MEKSLNGQIAVTGYHSLQEFKQQIKEGKLKTKAQFQLLSLRDTTKFEYYVKRYPLDFAVERKLIEGNRKDLFCIYFRLHRCRAANESLLIHYPKALSIYAKFHSLPEAAQMEMVQQKKLQTAVKYVNRRRLCDKALAFFRDHADKPLIVFYDRLYGASAAAKA